MARLSARELDIRHYTACRAAGGFQRRVFQTQGARPNMQKSAATANITDVRDRLLEVFDGLRTGSMQAKEAIEINNTAGKIISSAKVQIAYHALRGEAPDIPFLGGMVKTAALSSSVQESLTNEAIAGGR